MLMKPHEAGQLCLKETKSNCLVSSRSVTQVTAGDRQEMLKHSCKIDNLVHDEGIRDRCEERRQVTSMGQKTLRPSGGRVGNHRA